ncbi:MAG: efflux RND transporter permease subunit [Rhodopila sp.]|nr:efflux RND transporter permease subunit [Rhodopila sp.]
MAQSVFILGSHVDQRHTTFAQSGHQCRRGDRFQLIARPSGVGWVYEYVVLSTQRTLAELRSIQDWIVRYNLFTAKGIAEVASVGGFEKQYQVVVDPRTLQAYGIPLDRVSDAIRASNRDAGGRTIEMSETEYMVRG